jgi:nitrite reductase (cytochrome c-552)
MDSSQTGSSARIRPWAGWVVFLVVVAGVFGVGVMAASVMERRQEARITRLVTPVADMEPDPAVWGRNYPREYDRFQMTKQSDTRTEFGGADPRDYLAETPANVVLFAGYPFSKDYKQARGHANTVTDVLATGRINEKSPGTCWTCKSADVPRLIARLGAETFYKTPFLALKDSVRFAIGCLDCHDPKTMALRISRPALVEALARRGIDVVHVSHQEMRSLVCAQCHVEYYFRGEGKYATFPWDRGTGADSIELYYEAEKFSDWQHAVSKTPMLKMQHPDYEVYLAGVHAFRNVACADCHMPYRTEGGEKFTDHYIQSPLLNVANSCVVCHRWSEAEIRGRVEAIQAKVGELRRRAESDIARAHFDIAACMQAGATDEELDAPRKAVRAAQMRWDYVAASNGMGFHAPQECMRMLGTAADMAQEARVECARVLARRGYAGAVAYPNFSTKEKAQAVIKFFADNNPPRLLAGR